MISDKFLSTLKNEYWHPEPTALREALALIANIKTSDSNFLLLKHEVVADSPLLIIEYWDGEVFYTRVLPLLHCTVTAPVKVFLLLAPLLTALTNAKEIVIQIDKAIVTYCSDEVSAKFSVMRSPSYHPISPPLDTILAPFEFKATAIKTAVAFAEYASRGSTNLVYWTPEYLQGSFNMNSFRLRSQAAPKIIGFRTKDLLVIAALLAQGSGIRYVLEGSRLWLAFAGGWMSVGINLTRVPRWRDSSEGREPLGDATVVREDLLRAVRLMKLYPYANTWVLGANSFKLSFKYRAAAEFRIGDCNFHLDAEKGPKLWIHQDSLKVLLQALPVQETYQVRVGIGGLAFIAADSLYTISASRAPEDNASHPR